jgi:uncharacterized Zn finger protein
MGGVLPARPTVQGPVDAVPCAHCGNPQDFRELEILAHGVGAECDNCGKVSEIVDIRKVIVVRQA